MAARRGDRGDRGRRRPTPAAGAPSTGVNPCSSRLPNRSPGIMPRRPRSGDVASDWRSGVGRQDPAADSGPLRALHRSGPTTSRAPHHDGAAVPAHRHAHHEACRSTGKHPPPAAKTVRAAQDSLLLTNQERFGAGRRGGRSAKRAGMWGVFVSRRGDGNIHLAARLLGAWATMSVTCSPAHSYHHKTAIAAATTEAPLPI